jgi:uncharacterized protein (DUF305 family)
MTILEELGRYEMMDDVEDKFLQWMMDHKDMLPIDKVKVRQMDIPEFVADYVKSNKEKIENDEEALIRIMNQYGQEE